MEPGRGPAPRRERGTLGARLMAPQEIRKMVEAAGVEPASEMAGPRKPTCVSGCFISAQTATTGAPVKA